MSLEIGGTNALQPFMAAAVTRPPVVDADAWAAPFPRAQMTSFAIHELPMLPLILADVRDNAVSWRAPRAGSGWSGSPRKALTEMGSIAAACKAPRTGKEVKNRAILTARARRSGIGRTVQAARPAHRDPIDALVEAEQGSLLFNGKIHDVARRATEGFLRGTATHRRARRLPRLIASSSPSRTSSRSAGSTASLG